VVHAEQRQPPRGLLLLSIFAAVLTFSLKFTAYVLTDSVGLLSDALESIINFLAAIMAYIAMWYAARPADTSHTYGHEKIEFFASGLEGGLIVAAAIGIGYAAIERFLHPQPLHSLSLGIAISLTASAVNLIVAQLLLRVGRAQHSIILEADGHHLMTDVWSSVAVVVGLGVVAISGWGWLDPVIALLIAGHIIGTGVRLVRRSVDGLMDHALDESEQEQLRQAIRSALPAGTTFHALRTRRAGIRRFADFHLLVPGKMNVLEAHTLSEAVTAAVRRVMPIELTVHIEPIEEVGSWQDVGFPEAPH
jgi:cation diffusion facilitator family transporter